MFVDWSFNGVARLIEGGRGELGWIGGSERMKFFRRNIASCRYGSGGDGRTHCVNDLA